MSNRWRRSRGPHLFHAAAMLKPKGKTEQVFEQIEGKGEWGRRLLLHSMVDPKERARHGRVVMSTDGSSSDGRVLLVINEKHGAAGGSR